MRVIGAALVVLLLAGCAGGPGRALLLGKPLPPGVGPPDRPGPVYPAEKEANPVLSGPVGAVEGGHVLDSPGGPRPSVRPYTFEVGPRFGIVTASGADSRGRAGFCTGMDVGVRWPGGLGVAGSFSTHGTEVEVESVKTTPSMFPPDDPMCIDYPDLPECQGQRQVRQGRDTGRIGHLGLLATYSPPRSPSSREISWFVGAGPQYFWTSGFLNDDNGFGVQGEAGLIIPLSDKMDLRLGVEGHGVQTDVNGGDKEWLKIFGAFLGLSLDL